MLNSGKMKVLKRGGIAQAVSLALTDVSRGHTESMPGCCKGHCYSTVTAGSPEHTDYYTLSI